MRKGRVSLEVEVTAEPYRRDSTRPAAFSLDRGISRRYPHERGTGFEQHEGP
ncbi:hypothetical protein STRTUCAR8_04089, partial [Streptomyces turgidiscabies Car8]